MTAALSPDLAVAYVREMSADVRAAIVLGGDGRMLAGSAVPPEAAAELLAAAGLDRGDGDAPAPTAEIAVRVPSGLVVAVSTPDRAIVVAAGPNALTGPHLLDARAAIGADAAARPDSAQQSQAVPEPSERLRNAAERVISAAERGI